MVSGSIEAVIKHRMGTYSGIRSTVRVGDLHVIVIPTMGSCATCVHVREGHNLSRLHVFQCLYASLLTQAGIGVEFLKGPLPGGAHVIVTTPAIAVLVKYYQRISNIVVLSISINAQDCEYSGSWRCFLSTCTKMLDSISATLSPSLSPQRMVPDR